MRKISLALALIAVLAIILSGCARQEPADFFQKNVSIPPATLSAVVCNISGIMYYQYSVFIYHVNDLDAQAVYTPAGEYLRAKDYPRWQFKPFLDKNDSIYIKTKSYISAGQLPDKRPVICEKAAQLPIGFRSFLDDHEALYADNYNRSSEIQI
jgi:hypothetical protein